MELIDAIVVLGVIWSILVGVYLYLRYYSAQAMEMERFRQEKITERKEMNPREWWQDVIVNVSSNPAMVDKLTPLLGQINLAEALQQFLTKK